MNPRACRLEVNERWPRWLGILVGVVTLVIVVLYFAAPDVPKLPAIPLFIFLGLIVYASHRASQSWIEVSADGQMIAAIPSWYARTLAGEKAASFVIPRPTELRFYRNYSYGLFDKYSAVLRGQNGEELTVWEGIRGLAFQRCHAFGEELQLRFGLPVRLLSRRLTDQGTEEGEWTSKTGRTNGKTRGVGLAAILLPWFGIAVRVLTANPVKIAAAGVFLWAVGAVIMLVGRRTALQSNGKLGFATTTLVWSVQFAGLYVVMVLLTGALWSR